MNKFSKAIAAALCLFLGATIGAGAVKSERNALAADSDAATRYRLEFRNVVSNKIDNVSYDVEFSVGQNSGGAFFCNETSSPNDIVLEATTKSTSVKVKTGFYGLSRFKDKNLDSHVYSQQTAAFYMIGNDDATVNIFEKGKKTTVKYEVGKGPTISVDGAEKSSGEHVDGNLTWAQADAIGSGYFGYAASGGIGYKGNLTEFKYYDDVTKEDLGVFFSSAFTATVERYGDVGKEITVTPVRFGETVAVNKLQAVNNDGEKVELVQHANADGTITFEMPAEAVTVSPELTYPGHYKLGMDESTVSKLDNVSYIASFSFSDVGWIASKTATEGDITLSYTTELISHAVDLFGYVRIKDIQDPWAYLGNSWFATRGAVFNRVGKESELKYSAKNHTISATIDGEEVGWGLFPGESGGTIEEMDLKGAGKIGLAWNSGFYSACLSNLKIMDDDMWDLGFDYTRKSVVSESFILDRYAEANKEVTLKLASGSAKLKKFRITDDNGKDLDINVTDNGDETWSFTMPSCNVNVSAVYYMSEFSDFYGGYYNADTDAIITVGDESSITNANGKTTVTISLDNIGGITIKNGTSEIEGTIAGDEIVYEGKTYKRLRSYVVTFELNGGEGVASSQRINSGNYRAVKPEDPVKEGYVFEGWTLEDGTAFDFDKTVTKSVALYAKWRSTSGGDNTSVSDSTDSSTSGGKRGCKGSVGAIGISALAAVAAVAVLGKKKSRGE